MISDKGEVLSWGHGGHGQLGHSSIENQKIPTRIEALANERVIYIACGGSSSAAITGKQVFVLFKIVNPWPECLFSLSFLACLKLFLSVSFFSFPSFFQSLPFLLKDFWFAVAKGDTFQACTIYYVSFQNSLC